MSATTSHSVGLHDRPLAGILHMAGGAAALSGIDIVSKFVVADIPVVQMLALRAFFVMVLLAPFFRRHGGLALFRSRRVGAHLLRLACMLVSIVAFFQALSMLPLAMVVSLGFTAPLFVTALSVPVLGERVGIHRWAAVILGFVGTLIIVKPGPEGLSLVAILPVVAAFGWATAQLIVRRLAATESDATILIYLNTGLMIGLGLAAPFVWTPAAPETLGLCVVLGVLMIAAQWLMLRAARFAPIALVTPFQYLELPLAVLFGWLLWSEWPGSHVLAGAALIVASGLYVVLRERRRVAAARATAT
ncbi:MAG: DMT family transporter [Alphaproteobacteria bacterium]|nr:DMT family transporter [Alphaproteobacteria bacterium]